MLRKIFENLLHGDFLLLDGYKKYLGILLYLAAKFIPGFPVIDITSGVTADQALLIWGVVSDLYHKFGKKK
jgi:hypothetical protein